MATQRPLISSASGQFQRLPTSDTLDLSTLGTGTPDNTKFLRGDGSWAVPPSEATSLALSSITAATSANTIASGDLAQTWQWALTSIVKSGLGLTESAASVNGGSSQILLDVATLATSTATPLRVSARDTEAFRVNADGNVGIGKSNPAVSLDVVGRIAADSQQSLVLNSSVGTYATWQHNGTNVGDIGTANQVIAGGATTDFGITTRSTTALVFGTNTYERMRIDSAGNVGVGTATPTAKFEVSESTNTSLDALLVARGGNGLSAELRFLTKNSGGTNTGGAIGFDADYGLVLTASSTSIDGAQNVVIDSGGNVGIGTTAPGAQLHLLKAGGARARFGDSKNTVAVGSIEEAADSAIGFFTQSTTERMRIDSVGNVGIGTTNPTSRLHTNYPAVESAGGNMSQVTITSAVLENTTSYDTVEKLIDVTTGAVGGLFIAPMSRVGLHIDDLYCALGTGYKNGLPSGGLTNYGTYGVYVKGGGANYFAGRVGIATENPSVALDVTGEIKENGYYVVTQADVGTGENQVPLNQHLGELAFQSPESLVVKPLSSVTPANNGDMIFQLTSNTSLVIKVRGSDGVVRSATLTLA